MKLAIIGYGAIASYAATKLREINDVDLAYVICRQGREANAVQAIGGAVQPIINAQQIADEVDLVLECGGHEAFKAHAPIILEQGCDLVSVSSGVMSDGELADRLWQICEHSGARLEFTTGAVGAMDALNAARIGGLEEVLYIGRKRPLGWKGSRADTILNLESVQEPTLHFKGSAREAAKLYPKNANVAATIGMSGIGMEKTFVELYADPTIDKNIHELQVKGAFGSFTFRVEGASLPDNPKSSALTAMSVVSSVQKRVSRIST